MAVRGTTPGLVLTPARWATWVAQRHEWNGYLWIRWSDAEAILLFVSGRPRIHLWDGGGWAESEHALTTVAQRLERLPPPRWGQVAIPARWAVAIRELSLVHPALPAEIVPTDAWLAWAQRQGFTGLAVLVGEVAGAWILQDGLARAVRFQQGAAVSDDSAAPPQEGMLQIYRGRVALDLLLEPAPGHEFGPAARPFETAAAMQIPPAWAPPPPGQPVEVPPEMTSPAVEAGEAVPEAVAPSAPAQVSPVEIPAASAAKVSPPAPAESGETTVVPVRSEAARRFRGDERFLLAPTVDLSNLEPLLDLLTEQGEEVLGWLPQLDGNHTLEEIALAAETPLGVVDATVGWLADRRMVFRRYTARPRAPSPSP